MAEPLESRRARRWSRPPPPHDWRWAVGLVGRVLIAVGVLMFGFVAYQLWGTGIQYAQAQDRLDDEFAELLASAPTVTVPTTTVAPTTVATTVATTAVASTDAGTPPPMPVTSGPSTTVPAPAPPPPPIIEGDAIARLEASTIELDAIVVAGVAPDDLQNGPGHYPDTPLPGQLGNSAIAGHRTTFGQPFYRIDELQPGDEIVVTTVAGRFTYRVTGTQIVSPSDSHVIATTDPTIATLTLTSCHPRYTARERIIVSAALDEAASPTPGPPTLNYGRDEPAVPTGTLPGGPASSTSVTSTTPATQAPRPDPTSAASTTPATSASGTGPTSAASRTPTTPRSDPIPTSAVASPVGGGSDDVGDAFDQGWFDDDAAWGQVALWGFALMAISIGAYFLSRAARTNWAGGLAGSIPFVVCLYFFFQNVNRLLPAAL